jgi:hypothetical protein
MSKIIIEFEHEDVMTPRPWPVGINAEGIVTSGLGPDDGATLIGFGPKGKQEITVWLIAASTNPEIVKGLVPTFSNEGGLFEWSLPIAELKVLS